MKSICMIYPWFGKFNSYFSLWLESAMKNSTIDFLIYTENDNISFIKKNYKLSSNIKIYESSLEKIAEKISTLFNDIQALSLNRPYKLCDYKPLYCYIFDEAKEYDFWGFGDMDVILGDIRSFITEDVLNNNDVIGNMGHMQIIRNKEEFNGLIFKTPRDYLVNVVCDTNNNYFFDEKEFSRFNMLKGNRKLLIWDDVADVRKPSKKLGVKFFRFSFPCDEDDKHHKQSCYYSRNSGKLYLTKIVDKRLVLKEVIYAHFQKRKMKNCVKDSKVNYLCLPNRFVECQKKEDIEKKYRFHLIDFLGCTWSNRNSYFKHFLNRIKNKN